MAYGDNIRYVDNVEGDDGNDGLTPGAGGAWATIQHAVDQADTLSDLTIYVKNTGVDYTLTASLNSDVLCSSWLEGYTTTPGDGGRPTITKTGSVNYLFYMHPPSPWGSTWRIRHFRWTGADSKAIYSTQGYFWVESCEIDHSAGGIVCVAGNSYYGLFRNCYVHSLGGGSTGISAGKSSLVVGCYVAGGGAADKGIEASTESHIVGCVVTGCKKYPLRSSGRPVTNCTVYGGPTDGGTFKAIECRSAVNCIAQHTTGVGIKASYAVNCNAYGFSTNFDGAQIDCTELDPEFADPANHDFTPGTDMLAKGVPGSILGLLTDGYMDMGAVQAMIVIPDYPTEDNVIIGVSYASGTKTGKSIGVDHYVRGTIVDVVTGSIP